MEKKICISRAHLFFRLLYGAGGSHLLTKQEEKTVISAAMHVWRRTTGATFQQWADLHLEPMTDEQVVAEFKLIIPTTMVRIMRLNLVVRIADGVNDLLKTVMFAARSSQKSWHKAILLDFDWLCDIDAKAGTCVLKGIVSNQSWVRHVKQEPLRWKKLIKKIGSASVANCASDLYDVKHTAHLDEVYECDQCDYVCPTLQ